MINSGRKSERGMVLLVVLLVVALLVTILVEFAFSTLVDLRLAETFRDTTRAQYLARGGIRVGRIILKEDSNSYDATVETWGQPIVNYPVADGTVNISITDLGGRIDLNRLVRADGNIDPLFKDRALRLFELVEADDPAALTDALIDWLDPDDDSEPAGAESFYYKSLSRPYACKNGPLDTLDELNLVKGFDRTLIRKLQQHATVHGLERVNINTASREVILALAVEVDEATAEMITEARAREPFKSLTELKELPGMETVYGFIHSYVDVSSSHYLVEASARVNDGRRGMQAIIARDSNRILYKRVL